MKYHLAPPLLFADWGEADDVLFMMTIDEDHDDYLTNTSPWWCTVLEDLFHQSSNIPIVAIVAIVAIVTPQILRLNSQKLAASFRLFWDIARINYEYLDNFRNKFFNTFLGISL